MSVARYEAGDLAMSSKVPREPLPDEAWLGFGSNLGDRLAHIESALQHFSDVLTEVLSLIHI